MDDRYDLERFVGAQRPVIDAVRGELAAGRKRTHWMWFVFPQVEGLGSSAMAQRYAIGSLDEAKAYLAHPVLGPRLRECASLVLGVQGGAVHGIFGSPDDFKFHSSMTLFDRASPGEVFGECLRKFFGGRPDGATLQRLHAP